MRLAQYLVCVLFYFGLVVLGLFWILFLIPTRLLEIAWTALETKFNLYLQNHPELQEDQHADW